MNVNTKKSKQPKEPLEGKTELKSKYTLNVQKLNQYGTGTKTDLWIDRKYRKPKNKSMHLWSVNLKQRRQEYTIEKRLSLQ